MNFVKLCESLPQDYDIITNIREDKSCNEELMLGNASTVIFSKEQGCNRDSTENKVTEDTSSKDITEKM